ncbi:hypothetical protein RhiirA5_500158 [Rhizophagus irregularis]|uniref:Uncharacterized protein n=1 Tax=Rhizophagus irregularis TaxID=588596 RepID=A0A2N0PMZ1_9GLOM|nr:hypothetical protein RhiirA5_500158 [Rhizophagus irregularis]
MVAYRNLEILEIDFIDIYQINCMVKNSLCLRELRINDFHWNDDNFYNDSLNFIQTFLEKWKGRPAVSLYFNNTYFYQKDNSYMKLFDKYKIEKVIKDINV